MKPPKWLKLPNMWETFGTARSAVFEFGKTQRYRHALQVEALFVLPNRIGHVYQALTDEAQSFLYVPLLQRVWRNLTPVVVNGRDFYILSSRNRNVIDVPALAKFADRVKRPFKARMTISDVAAKYMEFRYDYPESVIDFEVQDCPTTIDPTAMDSDIDADFTVDSFRILQTKNLSFLEDTPRRQLLMSMAISGLLGMLMGGVMAFIGALIIIYFRR